MGGEKFLMHNNIILWVSTFLLIFPILIIYIRTILKNFTISKSLFIFQMNLDNFL